MYLLSVADKADTVSVNCENSKWGAGVNLTSLRIILPEMSKANEIFINEPQCYGFIYDDLLLFQQLYNKCDTNKTVHYYVNIRYPSYIIDFLNVSSIIIMYYIIALILEKVGGCMTYNNILSS